MFFDTAMDRDDAQVTAPTREGGLAIPGQGGEVGPAPPVQDGEEGPAPPQPYWEEEQVDPWDQWACRLVALVDQQSEKISSFEERLSVFEAQPIATHIFNSLEDTREQVMEHLVSEVICVTSMIEKKAEDILLGHEQKLEARKMQLSVELQDQLNMHVQHAFTEMQLQAGCARSENDFARQLKRRFQKKAQKIGSLEDRLASFQKEFQQVPGLLGQQLLKVEERILHILQVLQQQIVKVEEANVARVADKSQVPVVASPKPPIVRVIENLAEPTPAMQPMPSVVEAEFGFALEPIDEEITVPGGVSFFPGAGGNQDPTYAIRPVGTSSQGAAGVRQQPVCVLGDLVASQMATSLTF